MFSREDKRIVVWKSNKGYYFKRMKGYTLKHQVGFKNSYAHEVVLIIDLFHKKVRKSIKRRFYDKVISWLEKHK